MTIYKITNLVNGKIYIGQTIFGINHRFNQHFSYARFHGAKTPLARALRKYSKQSFVVEEIARASSRSELNELEKKYILEFKSHLPEIGYNLTFGGEGGGSPTPESFKNRSIAQKRRLRGARSDETRAILSAAIMGKRLAPKRETVTKNKRAFCRRGHPFDEINTYIGTSGNRRCRECMRYTNKNSIVLRSENS